MLTVPPVLLEILDNRLEVVSATRISTQTIATINRRVDFDKRSLSIERNTQGKKLRYLA